MLTKLVCLLALTLVMPQAQPGRVVINEIFYHAADDNDSAQYVEIFNPGPNPADLSRWRIAGGVKYTFPQRTTLAAGSFLVLCRDIAAFQRMFGDSLPAIGSFSGKLSHKGEKIELVDAAGNIVEKVHFLDKAPWPAGADGYGSSLERISVDGPADDPHNWAASHPEPGLTAPGSPGAANTVASPKPLPKIANVRWETLATPNQPIEVSVEVSGATDINNVLLQYSVIRPGRAGASSDLPMRRDSGTERSGRYSASIPAQAAGTLIRFTIQATDTGDATRVEPASAEPRPAFSAWVTDPPTRARIPTLTLLNPEQVRVGGNNKFGPPRRSSGGPGKSAALYVPPTGEIQLFDFVEVRRRSGGWKVHFLRDQKLAGMNAINLVYEGSPRWVLSEHLAYELYRKAGLKIQESGHARLSVDGRSMGYHLMVEQPNKNFLARSGRDESGNLYKVLWFGRGIVDQHEKKTNPNTGHDDIIALIENLRKKSGATQWAYINEQMNVDAFVNYYAVNMCIQNWDGFFNNHFVYHDLKPGGKWDIIPWDEDKTWGDYDGAPADYSWYDMPLTSGMTGDRSPRSSGWFGGGGGPFGGTSWWRPPGFLSGPLLANPQFRQKMEARVRELCQTVFTPEKFGPVVQDLQQRLRPEVEQKARAANQDPAGALKQFDADINSFHRQLVNRRKYILANLK